MPRFNFNNFKFSDNDFIRNAQQKYINGEQLTVQEAIGVVGKYSIDTNFYGYECKPDCAYRGEGKRGVDQHLNNGVIKGFGENDNFEPGVNNDGVDWFLGGVGCRYAKKGGYVIECPADEQYFVDSGAKTANDFRAKHLKSNSNNPIPLKYCKIMKVEDMKKGIYEDIREKSENFPYEEMPESKPPIIEKPSIEEINQAKSELGIKEPDIVIEKQSINNELSKEIDLENDTLVQK